MILPPPLHHTYGLKSFHGGHGHCYGNPLGFGNWIAESMDIGDTIEKTGSR